MTFSRLVGKWPASVIGNIPILAHILTWKKQGDPQKERQTTDEERTKPDMGVTPWAALDIGQTSCSGDEITGKQINASIVRII